MIWCGRFCMVMGVLLAVVDVIRSFAVLKGTPPPPGQAILLITVGLLALKSARNP